MKSITQLAHTHKNGTTQEQITQVAVSVRNHAALNPAAEMRKPMTINDGLNSPMVAEPLHALNGSLWTGHADTDPPKSTFASELPSGGESGNPNLRRRFVLLWQYPRP